MRLWVLHDNPSIKKAERAIQRFKAESAYAWADLSQAAQRLNKLVHNPCQPAKNYIFGHGIYKPRDC